MTAGFNQRSVRLALTVVAMIAVLLPAITASPAAHAMGPAVVLNEFMANNDNNLADNTGQFEDWIELHNTSASSVSLAGWAISDDDESYIFPAGFSVAANSYRVIFASGDETRTSGNELHLPFKLSSDGEALSLRDEVGVLSDPSWAPFPPLPIDVSYGRTSAGEGYFASPTPGSANNTASAGIVEPVTFSVPHGFYSSTQTVTLNTATPGTTIRYTLNGSTPSPNSGTVLSPGQSITVTSTSIVRAVAYRTGWITSTIETRSYLFTSDIVNQSTSTPSGWPNSGSVNNAVFDYGMDPNIVNGNEVTVAASLTSIPSLSIVTDQGNLTNASTGIYVNPWNTGIGWERPASVELIDPTGAEPGFDINAGLRIRGGGSRRPDNPKHSLRLYFRDDYGDGPLDYPLFGDQGVNRFDSLGLATGQNGSWQFRGEADATWIREMWSRETQEAMGQPHTDSRFYHVYLNGQYWGLYYSQERLSDGHGREHFGGGKGDYDVIGGNWLSAGTASDGTVDDLKSLYPLVSDLNVTATEFASLDALVDLENLADYFLLHYFTGDFDATPMGWPNGGGPWADSNNWRMFRNRNGVGAAGKWLFYDHDSEISLCGLASDLNVDNTVDNWNLTNGTVPNHQVPTPAWLHQALLTHPAYEQIFRDKVALHMQTPGGALTPAIAQARVDALAARVTGAIDAEAARWGDSLGDPANDRSDWQANVAELRSCVSDRFTIAQGQITADGLWPNENPPTISPAAGALPYGTNLIVDPNGETGTLWVTTDGTDPRAAGGGTSPTAFAYTGAIELTQAVTVRARVQSGSTWTPLAESSFTLSTGAGPVRLALNEYNAVSSSKFLGGGLEADTVNGTDATFGRIAGNGGDWFELIVLDDDLDIRGWTVEVWHLDNDGLLSQSAALEFASRTELSDLPAGALITVSEDISDDLSLVPGSDWHINLQANDLDQGQFFTAASQQNFAIDNDDTQIAIFDAAGSPVALRTGEGTVAGVSVSSEEVFKLEATPTTAISSTSSNYADGTSSTWGLPNVWGAGTVVQDLSDLRILLGDVNCSGTLDILDALLIAHYSVGNRTVATVCPIDATTEIMASAGDVNADASTDILDALLIAQCSVGNTNVACP